MTQQHQTIRPTQAKPTQANGILQRACACGQHSGNGGECSACKKKREGRLQRAAISSPVAAEAPPIVHDVLRSPGQPLDAGTRAFMEPRFGHDFSGVRVHSDARAAQSAQAVQALAYTVGRDVVFGTGQHTPGTSAGQRLMAHELTHVVQQEHSVGVQAKLALGGLHDRYEQEAEDMATLVLGSNTDAHNQPVRPALQRLPDRTIQRVAIYKGNILDEGSCAHLACNSKFACEDNENGITCPPGTRNASTTKRFRPLFTCDTTCENGHSCSDSDTWMAIPFSRFARRKCGQDLVICANGAFTHGQVRDRSEKEAFEVSHGIQDNLMVTPYASFTGSIYPDENDPDFKKDSRCHPKALPRQEEKSSVPDAPASN